MTARVRSLLCTAGHTTELSYKSALPTRTLDSGTIWYRTTSWTVRREWDCCGGQVSRATRHSQSRLGPMNTYWGTSILNTALSGPKYCYRRFPFRTIQSCHEYPPMSTMHTASAGMGVLMALMASVPLTLYPPTRMRYCAVRLRMSQLALE